MDSDPRLGTSLAGDLNVSHYCEGPAHHAYCERGHSSSPGNIANSSGQMVARKKLDPRPSKGDDLDDPLQCVKVMATAMEAMSKSAATSPMRVKITSHLVGRVEEEVQAWPGLAGAASGR